MYKCGRIILKVISQIKMFHKTNKRKFEMISLTTKEDERLFCIVRMYHFGSKLYTKRDIENKKIANVSNNKIQTPIIIHSFWV